MTVAQGVIARAPKVALHAPVPAQIHPGVSLSKIDRPNGPVALEAGLDTLVVARINRLAREAGGGPPDGPRRVQCLAPDYLLVVPPGERVVLPGHAAQDLQLIRLAPTAVQQFTGLLLAAARAAGRPIADRLLTDLVERLFTVAPGPRAESLLQTLLHELSMSRASADPRTAGGLTLRQLGLLRDHVEGRLDEPLRNVDLARLVDLSPFHFARAFKASMGAAPATWIRMRRLTVAQKLLTDPDRPVIDIAAAVGYESPSRFARAFRELTGLTPSAWRRAAPVNSD